MLLGFWLNRIGNFVEDDLLSNLILNFLNRGLLDFRLISKFSGNYGLVFVSWSG